MTLYHRFLEFVQTKDLFQADERILLALSGGLDSVVLAHVFRESGRPFGIAHCNFQLRGLESDGDEAFVRELAAAWDIPVYVQHFDTEQFAQENGISVQMAARDLRYAWFETLRLEQGFDLVATAHHLNDSVETALLNFTRGTGLSGLTGISPKNGRIVRPLLFASKPEIEVYAREQNIEWREDSSNQSDYYARNLVRHHVIPKLEALNPSFLTSSERTLRRLSETESNLRFLTGQYFGKNIQQIEKERLMALPSPRQMLHELLKPYGFTDEQTRQMAENLSKTGLEWTSPEGYRLMNDRDVLSLTNSRQAPAEAIPVQPDDLMVSLPNGDRLVLVPAIPGPPFPDGLEGILLDAGKLNYPMLIRPWQPGDFFQPFGMGGQRQKLQDFFTNHKLSQLEKEQALVLENGDGTIIWVIGYRLDERFKIEKNTQKALKINRVHLS